jgi:hypothetical protein
MRCTVPVPTPHNFMIRQQAHAGLKRAIEQDKKLGRPPIPDKLEKRIQSHLRANTGILKAALEFSESARHLKHQLTGQLTRKFPTTMRRSIVQRRKTSVCVRIPLVYSRSVGCGNLCKSLLAAAKTAEHASYQCLADLCADL